MPLAIIISIITGTAVAIGVALWLNLRERKV